ncbi:MAG: aminoacyltransferase [Clostridiales bacterium]|nr:aminoacyltransferase [Clostridiales bacterium]
MRKFEFIENLDREEFNSLALERGSEVKAHFLGSYEWGEVMARRHRKPHYAGVYEYTDGPADGPDRAGKKLVATAMILERSLIAGYTYFYIPRGFTMDYSDRELLRFITESLKKMGKKHKALYFKIDPDIKLHDIDIDGNEVPGVNNAALAGYLQHLGYKQKPLNYAFENEQPRFTFRIPLDGSIEEIEGRYSRTTKTRIRQSHEAGVEVFKGGSKDIPEFVRLMAMTEKRQDFYSHEHDFYQYFYDIMAKDDMITLYFGKLDLTAIRAKLRSDRAAAEEELEALKQKTGKKTAGKIKEAEKKLTAVDKQLDMLADKPEGEVIVSTYLITRYADKAWALYAANDMDYGKFFANYAVYQQQIRDSKEEGRRIFDVFGTVGKLNDDPALNGLYEFKKKWGGEFTEFIGEFDYILNKPVFMAYSKLIPLYHEMKNRKVMKQVRAGGNE